MFSLPSCDQQITEPVPQLIIKNLQKLKSEMLLCSKAKIVIVQLDLSDLQDNMVCKL